MTLGKSAHSILLDEIMAEYIVVLSDYREEDWGDHTLVPFKTFGPFNTEEDAWDWVIGKLPNTGIIHTMSNILSITSPWPDLQP